MDKGSLTIDDYGDFNDDIGIEDPDITIRGHGDLDQIDLDEKAKLTVDRDATFEEGLK